MLLLTARGQPEDIHSGLLAGANDYIIKPTNTLELKSRIRVLTDLTLAVRDRMYIEAAWLQAQSKPHFFFNTLNSILALSEIDTDRMHKLADAFSLYLHSSFDFRNLDKLVPLNRELELVQAYLSIEKERFEERLQVQWEVQASLEMLIPPLFIQPLVENAARHGILRRQRGGKIIIRIAEYGHSVEVHVEDDGVGPSTRLIPLAAPIKAIPADRPFSSVMSAIYACADDGTAGIQKPTKLRAAISSTTRSPPLISFASPAYIVAVEMFKSVWGIRPYK